jgi:PIN domain nuclease of toxin-antitoxin system
MRTLPFHHSDPFDRMLIAQAEEENLTIITHDKKFGAYLAKVWWT